MFLPNSRSAGGLPVVGCGHNLLVARINIKMKAIKKRRVEQQLDLNMLKDEGVRSRYAVEVSNVQCVQ